MAENSCLLIDNILHYIPELYFISGSNRLFQISDHHPYFLSICPDNKE